MLNNNKGGNNNREANSFNSYNSLNDFDLRFINNVEQLDDVLARFSRQPVSLYINRGLVKLGEQAIRLSYLEGGPWKSLSEFVEAAIYDLIKRRILKQSGASEVFKAKESDETSEYFAFFEHVSRQQVEIADKRAIVDPKCHFCRNKADKTAVFKPNGKRYLVCLNHAQKLADFPDKWLVFWEDGFTSDEQTVSNPQK